jgi:hypothetical protein
MQHEPIGNTMEFLLIAIDSKIYKFLLLACTL